MPSTDGNIQEFKEPVITIGRMDGSDVFLPDANVSRRHCAIVNYLDDVWIYDLGSTHGVFVDGKRIDRKVYLDGVHVLRLGETALVVCSKLGLLV
jgi:pSer/pThr/pTyr-binding forkhead associated (FHA) protein